MLHTFINGNGKIRASFDTMRNTEHITSMWIMINGTKHKDYKCVGRMLKSAIVLEVEFPTKSIEVHIETDENSLGEETLRILRERQTEIEIIQHIEHIQIEGNAIDSGNTEYDNKAGGYYMIW